MWYASVNFARFFSDFVSGQIVIAGNGKWWIGFNGRLVWIDWEAPEKADENTMKKVASGTEIRRTNVQKKLWERKKKEFQCLIEDGLKFHWVITFHIFPFSPNTSERARDRSRDNSWKWIYFYFLSSRDDLSVTWKSVLIREALRFIVINFFIEYFDCHCHLLSQMR